MGAAVTGRYLEHITRANDRWDLIAQRYYGDPKRIAPLLKANPEIVGDPQRPTPLVFGKGVFIRVPELPDDTVAPDALPPWKR